MWPNKFSTKSEGSKRGREGQWRERRMGETHPHYTVTLWILFSIGKSASDCGMAAWVPEMPGCVELKESLKEHQCHSTDAYLRNYSEWNWPFEAMTNLKNDIRLTAATTLNLSDLHPRRRVLWARASKSPLCATHSRPYCSSSKHRTKLTKADEVVGGGGGGFTCIQPLKQAAGAETATNPHLLLRREAVRQQHGNWGAMFCWHGMFTTHTWQF